MLLPAQSGPRPGPNVSSTDASDLIAPHRPLDLSQRGDYSTPKRRVKHSSISARNSFRSTPALGGSWFRSFDRENQRFRRARPGSAKPVTGEVLAPSCASGAIADLVIRSGARPAPQLAWLLLCRRCPLLCLQFNYTRGTIDAICKGRPGHLRLHAHLGKEM
jgi:hypothetical protein